jgi:hypothetical protein
VTAHKPAKRYQRKTVDAIYICGLDDEPLTLPGGDCSNAANHTPCPAGYVASQAWAERMLETHNQVECPGCGLFMIWEPKVHKETTS